MYPENPDPAFPSRDTHRPLSSSGDRGRLPRRRPSSIAPRPPATVAACHAVTRRPSSLVLRRPWPLATPSPVVHRPSPSGDRGRLPPRRPPRTIPVCLLEPVIVPHRDTNDGITRLTIWADLDSIVFPWAFALDEMHLFWEKVFPILLNHWRGPFFGTDGEVGKSKSAQKPVGKFVATKDAYNIKPAIWTSTGNGMAASSHSIPSSWGDSYEVLRDHVTNLRPQSGGTSPASSSLSWPHIQSQSRSTILSGA